MLLKYCLCTTFAQGYYSYLSHKDAGLPSIVQQVLKLKQNSFPLKILLSTSQVQLSRGRPAENTK